MANLTKWSGITVHMTSPSKRKTVFTAIKAFAPKVGAMFGRLIGPASWAFTAFEIYGMIFGSGSNSDDDSSTLVILPDSVARALTLDIVDEAIPPAFAKASVKAETDGAQRLASFYLICATYLSTLPYISGLMFTPERAYELLSASSDVLKKGKFLDEIPSLDDLNSLYAESITARRVDYIVYYLLISSK